MQPSSPEGVLPKQLLPQVTNEARDRIIDNLYSHNFEVDNYTFSKQAVGKLASANRQFVERLYGALNTSSVQTYQNDFALGMGIVLTAFDVDSDFRLIDGFSGLKPEDTEKAIGVVKMILDGQNQGGNVFENVLSVPQIPEQQINIRTILSRINASMGALRRPEAGAIVELGAQTMYKVLDELWPNLQPNHQVEQNLQNPFNPSAQPAQGEI